MDYLNLVSIKMGEAHTAEQKKFDSNVNPESVEKKKPKPKLTELFEIKKKDCNCKKKCKSKNKKY
tara:strand:+ start:1252 stop:1446 length:195 start_codon:yes stop_codon:yes gene_type:complete